MKMAKKKSSTGSIKLGKAGIKASDMDPVETVKSPVVRPVVNVKAKAPQSVVAPIPAPPVAVPVVEIGPAEAPAPAIPGIKDMDLTAPIYFHLTDAGVTVLQRKHEAWLGSLSSRERGKYDRDVRVHMKCVGNWALMSPLDSVRAFGEDMGHGVKCFEAVVRLP
jgi:hypothetical protein